MFDWFRGSQEIPLGDAEVEETVFGRTFIFLRTISLASCALAKPTLHAGLTVVSINPGGPVSASRSDAPFGLRR
ncbi:hypothetical protein [Bradyrhizobium zhanjiangense]|uniref:hypothetical protein n=1 Tax=Bradyrhizobium zhanjiangense TaxID=1325107 RepID=UPI001008846B|nr:hypothetical protein [Bradyrhizobium zhanjiangense]